MNYKLKLLDNTFMNSGDIQVLNNACEYYKSMLYYLSAMDETQDNNLFFRLVNICYTIQEDNFQENTMTSKAISLMTDFYINQKGIVNNDFKSFLNTIKLNYFSKERLQKDIEYISMTLGQYYIALKNAIENKQTKNL